MAPGMNSTRTKNALRPLGVLAALTGVTVLLTVLFSFLGTLSTTVVAGVMMGSARRWHWHTLPVSLVFPAVILGLSYYSKIELPPQKVYLIALVCGVAFWAVYGMMFFLHFMEQKQVAPSVSPAGQEGSKGGLPGTEADGLQAFSLAALRGSSWSCEKNAELSGQRNTLQIADGKFELSVSVPGGRSRVMARGAVSLEHRPGKLVINLSEDREGADGI